MTRKHSISRSLVLRELRQIKALAHPFRQRLLRSFAGGPQTAKQAADCLQEKPTKLYHHVDILADAGLLRLVEKRQKRGTVERYYQASAKQFSVDRHIFRHLPRATGNKGKSPDALFENAFAAALSEIRQSLAANLNASEDSQTRAALLQAEIRATPRQATALLRKLRRLCENNSPKQKSRRAGKSAVSQYRILLALYPASSRRRRRSRNSKN